MHKDIPKTPNSKCQHSIQEILEHMANRSMEEFSSPRRVSQKSIAHGAPVIQSVESDS